MNDDELDGVVRDVALLVRELSPRALALPELVADDTLGPAIAADAITTSERLTRDERAILIAGSATARAAFLDLVLGAGVFADARRTASRAVIRIRSGELDYVAALAGGGVEHFRKCLPDRDGAFEKAMTRAIRERDDACAAVAASSAAVALARRVPSEPPPASLTSSTVVRHGLWQRFVGWLLALFGRRAPGVAVRLPALSVDDSPTRVLPVTLVQLLAAHQEAAAGLEAANELVELLSTDRERYADQRRESLFDSLRELVDDLARGGEVLGLTIEVPLPDWPDGLVLIDAPARARSGRAFDGRLLVTHSKEASSLTPPASSDGLPTVAVAADASWERLVGRLERLRDEVRSNAAADAASRARGWITNAVAGLTRARDVCVDRIERLERQRLPDPLQFRVEMTGRIESMVATASGEIDQLALAELDARMAALHGEWRAAIVGCATRAKLDGAMRHVDESAPGRIADVIATVNELARIEVQRCSAAIERFVCDEISSRYHVTSPQRSGDGTPVIPAAVDHDRARGLAMLKGVRDAFEAQRVGIGLIGAFVCAGAGMWLFSIVGAVVGALIGVLAGFVRSRRSLERAAVARLRASMDRVHSDLSSPIASARRTAFARTLREFGAAAFESAMTRADRSITRLVTLEQTRLASERDRLGRLAEAQAAFEAQDERFAELATRLEERTAPRSATRSHPSHADSGIVGG